MPLQTASALPAVGSLGAAAWVLTIAVSDLTRRRIPNVLIFGALIASGVSFVFTAKSPLGASPVAAIIGVGLALFFTLPGYLMRRLGAGDVKLLLAIAALGGAMATLASFIVAALLAGGFAMLWLTMGPLLGRPAQFGCKTLPFGAALAAGFIFALMRGMTGDLAWPR